jgi:hypothetical protein
MADTPTDFAKHITEGLPLAVDTFTKAYGEIQVGGILDPATAAKARLRQMGFTDADFDKVGSSFRFEDTSINPAGAIAALAKARGQNSLVDSAGNAIFTDIAMTTAPVADPAAETVATDPKSLFLGAFGHATNPKEPGAAPPLTSRQFTQAQAQALGLKSYGLDAEKKKAFQQSLYEMYKDDPRFKETIGKLATANGFTVGADGAILGKDGQPAKDPKTGEPVTGQTLFVDGKLGTETRRWATEQRGVIAGVQANTPGYTGNRDGFAGDKTRAALAAPAA